LSDRGVSNPHFDFFDKLDEVFGMLVVFDDAKKPIATWRSDYGDLHPFSYFQGKPEARHGPKNQVSF